MDMQYRAFDIQKEKVSYNSGNYKEIKNLYKRSFPKNEQFPCSLMLLMAKRRCIEYYAYYEERKLCGFSYVVSTNTDAFILYLAVNDQIRARGYGTKILDEIKKQHDEKQISLNVEPIVKEANNLEQRKNRIHFYEKNGFTVTGLSLETGGDQYWILSNESDFNKEGFRKAMAKLSFGFLVPKITHG